MLIDCETCRMRDVACSDCVIMLLFNGVEDSPDLNDDEAAALDALAAGGLTPPLRLIPTVRVSSRPLPWIESDQDDDPEAVHPECVERHRYAAGT